MSGQRPEMVVRIGPSEAESLERIANAMDPSGLPLSRLIPMAIGRTIARVATGFALGLGFWLAAGVVGR